MLTIKEFEEKYGIRFTCNHTGKMSGFWSLSTSPTVNPNCLKRAKSGDSVCSKCYSQRMMKMYDALEQKLIQNTELLTTVIIPKKDLPIITNLFLRFEAFGDLVNEIQVVNYFNIAKVNPLVKCALWTKNPWIIKSAIEKYNLKKPRNLQIIGSSYNLNTPMDNFYKKYSFVDRIFTVYTPEYEISNCVSVNCGALSCLKCQKCYTGKHKNYEISERLK